MKYLLDTNIISELMKPQPNYNTICWLQDNAEWVGASAVTIEELYYGVMLLPEGKRKQGYRDYLDSLTKDLSGRTLSLDAFSGYTCAELRAKAYRLGRTPQLADLMIAAIAQANNCVVATRNVKDFEYLGVRTVNPFEYNPLSNVQE